MKSYYYDNITDSGVVGFTVPIPSVSTWFALYFTNELDYIEHSDIVRQELTKLGIGWLE